HVDGILARTRSFGGEATLEHGEDLGDLLGPPVAGQLAALVERTPCPRLPVAAVQELHARRDVVLCESYGAAELAQAVEVADQRHVGVDGLSVSLMQASCPRQQ